MKSYDEFKEELLQRKEHRAVIRRNRKMRIITSCVCLALCIALLVASLPGGKPIIPTVQAADLMVEFTPNSVTGKKADDAFRASQTEFALKLFQACCADAYQKSTLVSPLSVMLALSMTANGASGQTKAEMEAVLGMPIHELNQHLYSYVNHLTAAENVKLGIANSVWYRDTENLQVKPTFLQSVADYYGASAYKAPFDDQTLSDINTWVKEKTDGMINHLIDNISDSEIMYLINALVFDAKWQNAYREEQLQDGIFTTQGGKKQTVTMMQQWESVYLIDANATGFLKYYENTQYAFVAMLPNEGISVQDYVNLLTPESLQSLLGSRTAGYHAVRATMPKFSQDYDIALGDILKEMGISSAFDPSANFSEMAAYAGGNIYVSDVLHKTHIEVNSSGTKAAAVTGGIMIPTAAPSQPHVVTLDRPFVYMIIDTQTNLPLFMGTVMSIEN